MIEVENLTKIYGRDKRPAVDDVSFKVDNGEILGFRVSVLYNLSRDIGVIPTLDNSNNNPYTTSGPYFGVCVPTSGQYYIANQFSNREITILTVKVTTQGLAFSWYNPFSALSVFSVAWIGKRYTF